MRLDQCEWLDGPGLPAELGDLPGMAAPGEQMDARVIFRNDGVPAGWASLWWRETPILDGRRVGAIGGFGALDGEAAQGLLDVCCWRLREEGCSQVVGPMNGNTWRSYRHVVESNGRGGFLLEPRNPPEYPEWWRAAGFSEIGGYSSSAIPLSGQSTVPDALASKLAANGVVIRDLDMANYENELGVIHDVTLAGFSGNFLYTPLPRDAFLAAYQKVRDKVDPRFVRIAEKDGKAVAYVFAIADLEATARGERPALIIKTLTVDPAAKCAGLGSLLVDEVQRRGFEAGFREALHVLQYDDNQVLRITRRHGGERFRRYSLFSKTP